MSINFTFVVRKCQDLRFKFVFFVFERSPKADRQFCLELCGAARFRATPGTYYGGPNILRDVPT